MCLCLFVCAPSSTLGSSSGRLIIGSVDESVGQMCFPTTPRTSATIRPPRGLGVEACSVSETETTWDETDRVRRRFCRTYYFEGETIRPFTSRKVKWIFLPVIFFWFWSVGFDWGLRQKDVNRCLPRLCKEDLNKNRDSKKPLDRSRLTSTSLPTKRDCNDQETFEGYVHTK